MFFYKTTLRWMMGIIYQSVNVAYYHLFKYTDGNILRGTQMYISVKIQLDVHIKY